MSWLRRRRDAQYRRQVEAMTLDEARKEALRRGMNPDQRFLRTKLHGGSFKSVRRES